MPPGNHDCAAVRMELSALGFDRWREAGLDAAALEGRDAARVTAVDRGGFLVRGEEGELPAEIAGKLRFRARAPADLPCVGDWVALQPRRGDGPAIIEAVLPRRSFLRRKCAGRDVEYQMIAANLDTAFVVQSCHPDFNLRRLDRYLVAARDGGIAPVLLLTKTDLVPPGEVEERLEAIRREGAAVPVLALSNATGAGLDDFRRLLAPGRTHCLLGSSGVGKTTLLNRLVGRDAYETKEVSGTGEGIHTTSRRQLVVLPDGALMIDTPGMRELGLVGAAAGVEGSFGEIAALAAGCRYVDCTHVREPGCAVLAAVASGALSEERHRSYLKLRKESAYHEASHAERRKRDKEFGRFFHSAMKRMKR